MLDPTTFISEDAPLEAREEILNLYNLAVSLEPAIIALTRSCPFYEGHSPQLAVRTVHYRGNAEFGWEGVYTYYTAEAAVLRDFPAHGPLSKEDGLRPVRESFDHLEEQVFSLQSVAQRAR